MTGKEVVLRQKTLLDWHKEKVLMLERVIDELCEEDEQLLAKCRRIKRRMQWEHMAQNTPQVPREGTDASQGETPT